MKPRRLIKPSLTTCFSVVFLATTAAMPAYAFNPNDGADAVAAPPPNLPSTGPLTTPNYSTGKSSRAPLLFPPLQTNAAPAPITVVPAAVAADPAMIPPPASVTAIIAPPAPVYPPVDPVTYQKAQQQLAINPPPANAAPVMLVPPVPQTSTLPPPPPPMNFTPPAPLGAPMAAVAPEPLGGPMPVVTAPPPVAAPLSHDSKKILSQIPSKIDTVPPQPASKINVSRSTAAAESLGKSAPIDTYKSTGISISVQRPGLDTNFELNRAYTALSGGDTDTAITVYKNILSTEPTNQDALFGLASIYQRQGQIDKARPLYATLLKNYPNNRDGLNNFLTLISDESPQEALAELERLEQRNPDFSPIPAQEAILLNKLGYAAESRNKMLRAIELAPDNLTYKYNLAVMLDTQGNYAEAADIYRLLIDASNKGATLSTPADTLQKRLNYITTLQTESHAKEMPTS